MVKYKEENLLMQKEILSTITDVNEDIKSEYEAHILLRDTLLKLKEENDLSNFNLYAEIKDVTLVNWKNSSKSECDYFIKIFYNELNYVINKYKLKQSEVNFIYNICQYVSWESNLLVDKDGKPINQKRLCDLLNINRKTVLNNTKSLEEKKCLIRIYDKKDVYYIINPNICYKGQKINKGIINIFDILGYVKMKDRNKRT